MDNSGRMADQIAAEQQCRISTARRAVMVENYAAAGLPSITIAERLKLSERTIRQYAKRFDIALGGGMVSKILSRFFQAAFV